MPALPPSLRKKNQFGWAIGGFVLVAVLCGLMGLIQTHSSQDQWSPDDQDLDALNGASLSERSGAIRAPGGPLDGGDAASARSSLSGPIDQGAGGIGGEGSDSTSADGALGAGADSAGNKSADASGWGGEQARGVPGLNVPAGPKPTLPPMGGFNGGDAGGGGGAAAGGGGGGGVSSGVSPFGGGLSHPGYSHTLGLAGSGASGESRPLGGGSRSIDQLRQVAASGSNARAATASENAWGSGTKNFDGASNLPTMVTSPADSAVGLGSSVPANLKDKGGGAGVGPGGQSKSNVPPPGQPQQVNTPQNQNQMGQMLMMTLVSAMLSGVVGAAIKVFF